jgi:hypothetical protein
LFSVVAWWPGGLVDLLGHLQEVTQAAFDGGFNFGTETLLLAA